MPFCCFFLFISVQQRICTAESMIEEREHTFGSEEGRAGCRESTQYRHIFCTYNFFIISVRDIELIDAKAHTIERVDERFLYWMQNEWPKPAEINFLKQNFNLFSWKLPNDSLYKNYQYENIHFCTTRNSRKKAERAKRRIKRWCNFLPNALGHDSTLKILRACRSECSALFSPRSATFILLFL